MPIWQNDLSLKILTVTVNYKKETHLPIGPNTYKAGYSFGVLQVLHTKFF